MKENTGPILYIDDNKEDREIMQTVVDSLLITNKLLLFSTGHDALDYLLKTTEKPLLILCGINMPLMSGIELRRRINQDAYLRSKTIPFVFYTTGVNPQVAGLANDYKAQGFCKKALTYSDIQDQIRSMIQHWESSWRPTDTYTTPRRFLQL